MTTETGKRLLSLHASCDAGDCTVLGDIQHMVPAIEAEAVAAERARIAEAVRGLPQTWSHEPPPGHHVHGGLNRAAVLAIIEEKP